MDMDAIDNKKIGFSEFYRQHFLMEHNHPINIALHVFGTVLGIAFVILCVLFWPLYWLLLFLLVHALPGLVGHKLFERNPEVGDIRVLRKDFSPLWFIAANHVMTYQLIKKVMLKVVSSKK
jgi:hypothetical protein